VRWRPSFADGSSTFEKSFFGEIGAVESDVLAHIDRLYLKQTIIKHTDRAESTRFWNFSLGEIEKALHSALEVAMLGNALHLWVDVRHHRIDILFADSVGSGSAHCVDTENLLGTVHAHPLYKAPHEETLGIAMK
jgi:hypothetical protein